MAQNSKSPSLPSISKGTTHLLILFKALQFPVGVGGSRADLTFIFGLIGPYKKVQYVIHTSHNAQRFFISLSLITLLCFQEQPGFPPIFAHYIKSRTQLFELVRLCKIKFCIRIWLAVFVIRYQLHHFFISTMVDMIIQ